MGTTGTQSQRMSHLHRQRRIPSLMQVAAAWVHCCIDVFKAFWLSGGLISPPDNYCQKGDKKVSFLNFSGGFNMGLTGRCKDVREHHVSLKSTRHRGGSHSIAHVRPVGAVRCKAFQLYRLLGRASAVWQSMRMIELPDCMQAASGTQGPL